MRKLNYMLATLITMLLVVSCSNDEQLPAVNGGDKALVAFNLDLSEDGPRMRAIGDGKQVNELVYQVFELNKEGKYVPFEDMNSISQDAFTGKASSPNVKLTLQMGRTYKVAFWAQVKGNGFYTTTDLREVKVKYAGANNDDSRDAFFNVHEIYVNGDEDVKVVLRRPFAQLNVGSGDENVKITHSSVKIEGVANQINLLTGKTSGDATVNYTSAAIPADDLTVNKITYKYLSMSYILVGNNKETLKSVEYTFTEDGEKPVVLSRGLTNVPVQRNHRTNIVGNLLTADIDYDITIDTGNGGELDPAGEYDANTILIAYRNAFNSMENPDKVTISMTDKKIDVVFDTKDSIIVAQTTKDVIKTIVDIPLNITREKIYIEMGKGFDAQEFEKGEDNSESSNFLFLIALVGELEDYANGSDKALVLQNAATDYITGVKNTNDPGKENFILRVGSEDKDKATLEIDGLTLILRHSSWK